MLRADLIPTPEDWQAIQGGKPRIFESPTGASFELVHVYDRDFNQNAASRIGHYGFVITTIGERFKESLDNPIEIEFYNKLLEVPERCIVRVPAALLIQHHGKACMERSFQARKKDEGYKRLDVLNFRSYIGNRTSNGWREKRLGVDPSKQGYKLTPIVSAHQPSSIE